MTLPDPIADLIALLEADAAVAALASTRIFGGELPQGETGEMPRNAVVITEAGGTGRPGTVKYRRVRFDTICYGATLAQSKRLHNAVREAIETMSRPHGSLKSIEIASEAINARDPLKEWPTCFASYYAITSTRV